MAIASPKTVGENRKLVMFFTNTWELAPLLSFPGGITILNQNGAERNKCNPASFDCGDFLGWTTPFIKISEAVLVICFFC